MSKVQIGRNWLFLLYPESMVPNAFQVLEDTHFEIAISPLHSHDFYTEDDSAVLCGDHVVGEVKKAHYHVVLHSNQNKSYNQMMEIARRLARDPDHPVRPILSHDLRKDVRYLVHEDNKNKTHYDASSVTTLNGFDLDKHFNTNAELDDIYTFAIEDFMEEFSISEYWSFLRKLRSLETYHDVDCIDLYRYAKKHTLYCNALLRSRQGILRAEVERESLKEKAMKYNDELKKEAESDNNQ